ncbi:protein crossbronx homolog [Ctenocephalides felis]|uniref:protein crossbronx homolog n=1 Tax=Ctenocephalides felis TaxID=7515 RepID=UPI000E6E2B39|nr:protein crossbronx homolog [Ctenocephalides felis]
MDKSSVVETNVDDPLNSKEKEKCDSNVRTQIFHKEYQILAEYKLIQNENITNTYVIPSFESSFLWFGVIFLHEGFYAEAVFRFNIIIPETFPDGGVPTVIFQNKVYHPHINENTGVLDLSIGFSNWKFSDNHIWQLLKYIKWVFHNADANPRNEILNKEAFELLHSNRSEFTDKVKLCVQASIEAIYDPPPTTDKHYIAFEKYNEAIHEPLREMLRNDESKSLPGTLTDNRSSGNLGLSWIEKGSFTPLSKNNSDEST